MSRPILLISGLFLVAGPAIFAQQRRYRETAEPPLADEAGTVLAASREPRALASSIRLTDAPVPVVLLQVRTPQVLPVGKDVEVRLVVENAGRASAKNVAVSYPLSPGIELVKAVPDATPSQGGYGWMIPALAAAERKEISLTLRPGPNATELDTRAFVQVQYEQSAKTRFAKPELTVRKTGPEQAQCHDYLVFGMEVTNTSDIELNDVTLQDDLPEGLLHRPDEVKDRPFQGTPNAPMIQASPDLKSRLWKIGRLAPRQTRRVEYYVTAASPKAGPIDHKAVARAADGASAVAQAKVVLSEPKLELKAEAPPRLQANSPARVRVTLANRSSRALANIVVTDEIADDCQIENISNGGQLYGKRVQWIVPALPPNEERVLEMVVRQPAGGSVRHSVAAVYRGLTPLRAEAATTFDASAALSWDFRGTPATVEVNGEITYTVTVQNTGMKPAKDVRPVVELPPELHVVKAEPKESKVEGSRVTFDPVELPPNGKAIYRVRAKAVKASNGARVQADLRADLYAKPVHREELTAIGGNESAPPPVPPPTGPMPRPVQAPGG